MTSNLAEVDIASAAREREERIRSAITDEWKPIRNAVAAMVKSVSNGLHRDRLVERVDEVLSAMVCEALARPATYQLDRPVLPWLVGIARNLLKGEARDAAAHPRQNARGDMDEATWEQVVGLLASLEESASARIDVEHMLSRLSPSEREVLECRYLKGLKGQDLAEALGISMGAARTRVSRAVQTLRDLFASEVAR